MTGKVTGFALVFSLLAKGYGVGTPSCWRGHRPRIRIRHGDNHANNLTQKTVYDRIAGAASARKGGALYVIVASAVTAAPADDRR
jgi:hypothetical protein